MANQILAGAVFQAGQVIAGVDANNPPYVGPPVGKFITRSISGGYPKTISLRSVIDIDADPITTITNTSSYFGTRFASDPNGRYLAIGDTVNNKVFVYNTQDLGADPTVVDYPSSGSAAVLSMNSDKLFVGKTTIYAYDLSDLSAAPTTISAPSSEVADYGFGSDIACNSTHLFIGSQYARIDQQGGVQSSGADSESGKVHVWNISTEQYEIDLYGTDVEYGDKFGSEIKVTDTHVAIGAYGADTSPGYQPETGAVYLFDAQDLSATPTKLTGGGYGDEYGRNIDLNSTHLAVSEGNYSGYSDTGASLQENGRLFIYSLTNLSNPTIKTGNLYSEKYGINPNLFKDGSGRISFYRSLANTGGPTKYFVYNINDLDTPLWESETEQPVIELPAYVAPPPPAPASYFMVAAPYDDGGGDGAGEVYVYNTIEGDDSSPDLTIPSPSGYRAYFGHQMAQNSTHIAIAAYGENTYKGAVYLYDKSDLTATPQRIEPSGLSTYDFISAYSLAMSDTHLVFGNFGDDSRGSNAGSAFIYNLDTMQYTELFPPGSGSNIQFGFSCALSDTHVVITAAGNPAHNGGLAQNAYAWPLSSGNSYSSTPPVRFNPDQYQPINGHTIALSGGQGGIAMSGNKVFIGDTGYDAPADPVTGYNNDNTGAVYMLDMENPNADPVVFTDPSPRDNPSQDQTRQLGHSVRVSGNKLYAGAPSGGEHNSGLVLVWDIEDPSTVTKIAPSNAYYGQPNPAFGERISVQGASLLVGAPTYVESGSSIETGAAYLYNLNDLSQTGFLITNTTSNDVDRMGMGVLAVE